MYQTTARKNATIGKIHAITQHIYRSAKTAIDIGSQEGIITVRLADLGISAVGYEANKVHFSFAVDFAKSNYNSAKFINNYLDLNKVAKMENVDVILFLSVYHQLVKENGIEYGNKFLVELFKKANYQLFFEPCMIYEKYGCEMPFIENDYSSILDYFKEVLRESNINFDVKQIGIFSNNLPQSEPFRPLLVFSKVNQEVETPPRYYKLDIYTLDSFSQKSSGSLLKVPLDKCIHYLQSFGDNSWHYFAATAEFLLDKHLKKVANVKYEETPLYSYYKTITPRTYGDLWEMAGNESDIGPLMNMPLGHYCEWRPWEDRLTDKPEDMDRGITKAPAHPPQDSHCYGPTTDQVGIFEVKRLHKLLMNFLKEGYQPEIYKDGYIRGQLIKNNNDARFLISAGGHRIAVLKALGYKWIIVKIQPGSKVIYRDDAPDWPQVKNKVYSIDQALNYFDDLFNVSGEAIGKLVEGDTNRVEDD